MDNERLNKRYEGIYNDITNIYKNEFLSIPKACKKIGVSMTTFYRACKVLKKDSPTNNKIKNNKIISNHIIDGTEPKPNQNTTTDPFDEKLAELANQFVK
jgi:hypothetical protein